MKKSIFILPLIIFVMLIFSCDSLNPLYGRWADSYGNYLILNDAHDYKICVTSYENGTQISTEDKGTYIVDLNTIILKSETDSDAAPELWEWDVIGKILYLTYKTQENYSSKVVINELALTKVGSQVVIE